jgi:NAD(P)-dependent dehydrogenase (short-subunit alcohol dehydrogenase family)
MASFLLPILKQPFQGLPLPPAGSYANKTVIITGGNTGIGLGCAAHVLRLGATRIILAVRSVEKGEAAAAAELKSPHVEVWHLDLASFASVAAFAKKVRAEAPEVDVAFLNAGVATWVFAHTEDGWETMLQVNALSTALLGLLLLPIMRGGRGKKIVFTGSSIHKIITELPEDGLEVLNAESYYRGNPVDKVYAISKMLGNYAVRELAKLVPAEEVMVVNVCPGFVKSELRREGVDASLAFMAWAFGRTVEQGSRTIVHAGAQGAELHGLFTEHCRVSQPGPLVGGVKGEKVQERIWDEMVRVLVAVQPEVEGIVAAKI